MRVNLLFAGVLDPVERREVIVASKGRQSEHREFIQKASQSLELKLFSLLAALKDKEGCLLVLFFVLFEFELYLLEGSSYITDKVLVDNIPLAEHLSHSFKF